MKIESMFIAGEEKEMNEIMEEVRKRIGKEKIHTIEINPAEFHDDNEQDEGEEDDN